MRLADDMCRCWDDQCKVRAHCERWLQRRDGGPATVHAATLRPAWQCHDELCDNAITGCEITEDME